jgi:hypothetical protein
MQSQFQSLQGSLNALLQGKVPITTTTISYFSTLVAVAASAATALPATILATTAATTLVAVLAGVVEPALPAAIPPIPALPIVLELARVFIVREA